MKLPLQVTFHGLSQSDAIERWVRSKAERLAHVHPRITACRVAVQAPHHRHRKGNLFRVRVDLTVPTAEIVTGRTPPLRSAHEDVYVAVRDAFHAARRSLMDVARTKPGRVKPRPWARSIRDLRQERRTP